MKLTNENRWLIKAKDWAYNSKQSVTHKIWYPIFDRFRLIVGVRPQHGDYFLRLQLVRQTVRSKSRELKQQRIIIK